MKETKHHMGRRCLDWDYKSRAIYMITISLSERGRPIFGKLEGSGTKWHINKSRNGNDLEELWLDLPNQWPGIQVLASQVMPDHFHGIIFVKERQEKPLGNIIGSFKARTASKIGIEKLWAPGFVDTILFRKGQLQSMIDYIRDNPRRLGIKRDHPDLFKVICGLEIPFHPPESGRVQNQIPASGRFFAIGNRFLLSRPVILQIQCSRSILSYKREQLPSGKWRLCRDKAGKPIIGMTSEEFEKKARKALAAAAHGAVLLSPCISHGEREIARRAYESGHKVITLQNKGFPPIYKPGGKKFESCAAGNLLMLAPAGWEYVPGDVPMTRIRSQVLNRIAQLIAGEGAIEIDYKGAVMEGIDEEVVRAVKK